MKNDRVKSWHVEYSHREELARPKVTATANVPPLPIRWGPREMYLLLTWQQWLRGLWLSSSRRGRKSCRCAADQSIYRSGCWLSPWPDLPVVRRHLSLP